MDGQCHKGCLQVVLRGLKDFIENCNEDSDEGYFLEIDVQYPEKLRDLHNDLPFLSERIKIEKNWETFSQLPW